MKELDIGYDISVSNMNDISTECGDFTIEDAEFYDINLGKLVNKKVLVFDSKQIKKQIFSMTDGIYILEIEEVGEVEYFYSKNINDLV